MNATRILTPAALLAAIASASSAGVTLRVSEPLLLDDSTDLVQLQVTAVADPGEVVAAIGDINVTGVHQVHGPSLFGTRPTPTNRDHLGFPEEWIAYDTFVKLPEQNVGWLGDITEEPLEIPPVVPLPFPCSPIDPIGACPVVGFSDLISDEWEFPLVEDNQAPEYNFLQVVTSEERGPAVLDIEIVTADEAGNQELTRFDAFELGVVHVDPPILATDLLIDIVDPTSSGVVTAMLENTGGPAEFWELGDPVFTADPHFPDGEGINNPASISAEGEFSWDPFGSSPGQYEWAVTATNAAGVDTALISVVVPIPEPASMGLVGLALAGVVGFARRRSTLHE